MSIEVKQLVVKADLRGTSESMESETNPAIDIETLREGILEDCRRMLEQLLEQQRER
ncbi:MAG: hypothetical protein GY792_13165 [Gammaproteobacteria bacterium]|nr:hypothetical protein [Gammaproteobacteria bacterium]